MSTINVRYKPNTWTSLGIWFQGFSYHQRPQVRATNPNIDHISDSFSSVAFPFTTTDFLAEVFHFVQHFVYFWNNIFPIYKYWGIGTISQSNVKHSSVLSEVDLLSTEHSFSGTFHTP